jgi:ABC-2 type transport system permease protein
MFCQLLLLIKTNVRAFRAKARRNVRTSKLMLGTLGLFLLTYLISGYLLFSKGLHHLYELPGVGMLLVERVLYMLYFFFFVMLVFSNSVLLYAGLFRGKETSWLLTLPIDQRAIFCWKVIESLVISTWGLAILSAPMLLAFGHTLGAGPWFYVKAALVFIPYFVLPGTIAAGIVVVMVQLWRPFGKWLLWALGIYVVYRGFGSFLLARHLAIELNPGVNASLAIEQVFSHTALTVHPLLPSTWMSEMILHWARGYEARGLFYTGLLLSYAALGLWLCVECFSRYTFVCWNTSQANKAALTWKKSGRSQLRLPGEMVALNYRSHRNFWRHLGVGRINAALLQKESREFRRDPSQWIPSTVLFGLLFLYSFNIRYFATDANDPFWVTLISFLNFGVSSLAVSTLCTRFIYPLFSLEGRRLWISGLAPVPLSRIFWIKFFLFAGAIALITSFLMLLSGTSLLLPWQTIFRFIAAICLVSMGLTSLSLGLGVLFPNFNEQNPSKIVSGFGGTLCLILNFIFILLFLTFFMLPTSLKMKGMAEAFEKHSANVNIFCTLGLVGLAAVTTIVPIFLSLRRIKSLEMLGMLDY